MGAVLVLTAGGTRQPLYDAGSSWDGDQQGVTQPQWVQQRRALGEWNKGGGGGGGGRGRGGGDWGKGHKKPASIGLQPPYGAGKRGSCQCRPPSPSSGGVGVMDDTVTLHWRCGCEGRYYHPPLEVWV